MRWVFICVRADIQHVQLCPRLLAPALSSSSIDNCVCNVTPYDIRQVVWDISQPGRWRWKDFDCLCSLCALCAWLATADRLQAESMSSLR
jgi:hypothetical protein